MNEGAEGFLRNDSERLAATEIVRVFEASPDSTADKLTHFAKYVRRQDLTRMLARYELMRRILDVKGSIVECGVYRGSGLMTWANLCAVLEPTNLTRRIYGFDTFGGFPAVAAEDSGAGRQARRGDLASDSQAELSELIAAYDLNRPLGHVPKVELVPGDAAETIPKFVADNPHLVVSLLFCDFDLYEPTMAALEHLLPLVPRGGIVAFDELDNPAWPGETRALDDAFGIGRMRLQRLEFDPYVAFAVMD